jgi:hypothetical protein
LPAAPAQIAEEARDEAGERAWQEAGEQA